MNSYPYTSSQVSIKQDNSKTIEGLITIAERTNYISRIRDLALLDNEWGSGAQPLPQDAILLNPGNFEDTLEDYIEAYSHGERQDIDTADLTKFPSKMCIEWSFESPCAEMLEWEEFATFVRCCGKFITEMWVFNCSFACFEEFYQFIRGFPNLFKLRIADCTWGVSTLRQARLYGAYRGQLMASSVKDIPSLLDTLSISIRNPLEQDPIYDLTAFTTWIMQEPIEELQSVVLDMSFTFTELHEQATRSILHSFGPTLVEVSFNLSEPVNEEFNRVVALYPNLSANTRLKSLSFDSLASDLMRPNYLLSTLSSVTSPALEYLSLIAELYHLEDAQFNYLGLDSVVEHLAFRSNFPSLKLVELIILNSVGPECPRGIEMWRFIHERMAPLRQKGVQVKCRLECPDEIPGRNIYFYNSVSYEKGEYETNKDEEDLCNTPLMLRSYNE